ncbi:hypothetical protein [Burkholderia glumae]|uniref:MFS transporter n=1 Tax=Burkholderia glumae TaxID=337 RepID=A0AAP9XYZ1_BURGL|nr:hypothetical protein [Burkholderia glumae]ACR30935.1 Major facilitator superfamily MFS_1 [Burkholderia glumae BGR1]AJY62624.1 major facilitator superfamily MFS_1 [Burkholderia glumae LMG 2196 = ATCC 33617]KHJ61865.1 MFS transporter [Burkholderia glumae]MCM2483757.1 MFS transporter [Burkholderia glumae]MCM2494102.1 MFS transporter [Burkholderia glumae]
MIPYRAAASPATARAASGALDATCRKLCGRLAPFLMPCHVVTDRNRAEVGFAKRQMARDPAFSATVFGLGAGLFLGYFLFALPSKLRMRKAGAKVWIARIIAVLRSALPEPITRARQP